MNEKIQQIEEEVMQLFISSQSDKDWKVFWLVHVKPVIERVKIMAEKYGANREVLWLSAIFHDTGYFESIELHAEIGSERAYSALMKKGFDVDFAKKVKETILTHSVREYVPQTLEQKILATADAMCHFTTPFYFWLSRINDQPLEKSLDKIKGKIEKDFEDKILFEEEKKEVAPQYKMLKDWFKYEN